MCVCWRRFDKPTMEMCKLFGLFYTVTRFQHNVAVNTTDDFFLTTNNVTNTSSTVNATGREGNLTSQQEMQDPAWSQLTKNRVLFLVLVSTIMLMSLAGNSLVLVVVFKNYSRKLRAASHSFIANISIASLVYTVCYMPRLITAYVIGGYRWLVTGTAGYFFCNLTTFSAEVIFIVPALSLIFIAVDRLVAVFFPMKRGMSVKATFIIICCIWLVAIAFTIPESINIKLVQVNNKQYCIFNEKAIIGYRHYLNTMFAVCLALPLVTALILYSAIVIKLFCGKIPGNQSAANQEVRDRRSRKVLLMSVVTNLFFVASVTPKWICIYFPELSCGNIPFALLYVFCSLNSCIYAAFSKVYRNALREILCFRLLQNHSRLSVTELGTMANKRGNVQTNAIGNDER